MRAYRLRVYPTRGQERELARWFGHARWVWSWALDARRKAYGRRGETLTSVDLLRMVTRIKRSKTRGWLAEVPSSCLAQKLRDLDAAYRNAFAGCSRLPRFKSRRGAQRVRVAFDQRHAGKVRAWLEGRMVLPGLGAVKLRGRALPTAMPKLVTVSHDTAGRWWVSFTVDEVIETMALARRASIGVDVGVRHLAVLSTGEAVVNPRTLCGHLVQLARLQQRFARQRVASQASLCAAHQRIVRGSSRARGASRGSPRTCRGARRRRRRRPRRGSAWSSAPAPGRRPRCRPTRSTPPRSAATRRASPRCVRHRSLSLVEARANLRRRPDKM